MKVSSESRFATEILCPLQDPHPCLESIFCMPHLDTLHVAQPKREKIAIYGGAFNPIHSGHLEVIFYLAQRRDIDEVFVMPSSVHPFGKKLQPFQVRKELIESALDADPRFGGLVAPVTVVDTEREIAESDKTFQGYTYQVLSYIKRHRPDADISFCMGADNIEDMINGKWDMSYELAQEFGLIVAGRGSLPSARYACYSWYDGGADFLDVSSTRIRKSLENPGTDKQAIFLCPKVIQERVKALYSTES
jgi:nicotinate (nicotinamide) nucleotide adenylyltransferase